MYRLAEDSNIDKAGKFRGTTPKDLNEAMQYATLGGYSQLEPFQEYLSKKTRVFRMRMNLNILTKKET